MNKKFNAVIIGCFIIMCVSSFVILKSNNKVKPTEVSYPYNYCEIPIEEKLFHPTDTTYIPLKFEGVISFHYWAGLEEYTIVYSDSEQFADDITIDCNRKDFSYLFNDFNKGIVDRAYMENWQKYEIAEIYYNHEYNYKLIRNE